MFSIVYSNLILVAEAFKQMKVTAITKNRLQYFWRILVIILLNLLMIAIATRGAVLETIGLGGLFSSEQEAVQTLSKVGSRGDEVRKIQEKLTSLGY